MSRASVAPTLVLGLGNVLCGDDGAGVAAVTRLQRQFAEPPGVAFADGGTLGLTLLSLLRGVRRLILVDAIDTGGAPGTLVRLNGDEVGPAVRTRLSPHQVGVADLLEAMRLLDELPEEIVLLGLVPASTALGLGCSAPVRAALPELVAAVVEELRRMGHPLETRTGAGSAMNAPPGDLAPWSSAP